MSKGSEGIHNEGLWSFSTGIVVKGESYRELITIPVNEALPIYRNQFKLSSNRADVANKEDWWAEAGVLDYGWNWIL